MEQGLDFVMNRLEKTEKDGKAFELGIFGAPKSTNLNEERFIPNKEDLYGLVMRAQSYDPKRPTPSFSNKLLQEIVREMLIKTGRREEFSKEPFQFPSPYLDIRLYSAVNSGLDERFGVDAFIDWYLPDGTLHRRVTLDATLKSIKEKQKADILFSIPRELKEKFQKHTFIPDIDKGGYNGVISELASLVVLFMKQKELGEKSLYCEVKKPSV